jgi:hypothetical protein
MAAPAGRDGVGKAKPPSSSRTARVAPVLALALEIRTAVSNHEVRDLIRRMNAANPPWGLPRIHGELLKIGIEISQRQLPSTWCENEGRWRSFLRNPGRRHSCDRYVRGCVRLVSAAVCDDHPGARSQKDCAFPCHAVPDLRLASATGNRSVPLGQCSTLSAAAIAMPRMARSSQASRCDGNRRDCQCAAITLGERIRRARHRFDSS